MEDVVAKESEIVGRPTPGSRRHAVRRSVAPTRTLDSDAIRACGPPRGIRDLPVNPTKPLTKDIATPPESGNRRLFEPSGNYSYPSMRRQALVERSVEIL